MKKIIAICIFIYAGLIQSCSKENTDQNFTQNESVLKHQLEGNWKTKSVTMNHFYKNADHITNYPFPGNSRIEFLKDDISVIVNLLDEYRGNDSCRYTVSGWRELYIPCFHQTDISIESLSANELVLVFTSNKSPYAENKTGEQFEKFICTYTFSRL